MILVRLIDIIIEELKSSINSQNDLNSYFDMKTKLIDYKIKDNKIELKFNEYIFNNEETQEEEKFILTNSIFENYDINEININDKYFFKRYYYNYDINEEGKSINNH